MIESNTSHVGFEGTIIRPMGAEAALAPAQVSARCNPEPGSLGNPLHAPGLLNPDIISPANRA